MISGIKTIVIADDSGTARMIIRKCLEIVGLGGRTFLEANNGGEALELLQREAVDLLVTDLNMPVLGGRALLERIKSSPHTASVPVIVITSSSNQARERELKGMGAACIVNKPVSPAAVAHALEVIQNITQEVTL